MTEAEWNACLYPQPMLNFLEDKGSTRKWRLAGVACCRGIWSLLPNEESRRAVELSELYADGLTTSQEMGAAQSRITPWHHRHFSNPNNLARRAAAAAELARIIARPSMRTRTVRDNARSVIQEAWRFWRNPVLPTGHEEPVSDLTREKCCGILRCVFGPLLFRPVTLDPSLFTSTVKQLADGIYEEKGFDRMPILGDALEEAGCDNSEILSHCRQSEEHVRGCWLVDLVLGKE